MGMLKPDRHELFAQYMVKGMTQGDAYVAAGYKPSPAAASRLSKNINVINRMAELRERQVHKGVILSKQWLIEAAIENAEIALGRRPVKVGKAEDYKEVYVYKGDVANQAVKMLGSEFSLFTERKDVRITNEFAGLSDAELAQRLVEVGQQMLLGAPPDGVVIDHEGDEGDGGDD